MWSGDELCWSVQGHRRQAIGYGLEYFYSEERLPVSAHWKMTWQQENESGWLMRRRVITGTGSTRTRSASFKTSFLLLPSCRLVRSLCRQYKKQFLSHTLYLPEVWTKSPQAIEKQFILTLFQHSWRLDSFILKPCTIHSPTSSTSIEVRCRIYKGNGENFLAGKCFDNKIPEGWKFYSKENWERRRNEMESQRTFSWISKAFIPKGIEGLSCYSKCGHFDLCIVGTVAWSTLCFLVGILFTIWPPDHSKNL